MIKIIINAIVILLNLIQFNIKAQCPTSNTTDVCALGNGSLVDNTNINTPDKYWWNGGVGTRNNINFNGGRLVVCSGNLTISSGTFNSGDIIILSGATLSLLVYNNLNSCISIIMEH